MGSLRLTGATSDATVGDILDTTVDCGVAEEESN